MNVAILTALQRLAGLLRMSRFRSKRAVSSSATRMAFVRGRRLFDVRRINRLRSPKVGLYVPARPRPVVSLRSSDRVREKLALSIGGTAVDSACDRSARGMTMADDEVQMSQFADKTWSDAASHVIFGAAS